MKTVVLVLAKPLYFAFPEGGSLAMKHVAILYVTYDL